MSLPVRGEVAALDTLLHEKILYSLGVNECGKKLLPQICLRNLASFAHEFHPFLLLPSHQTNTHSCARTLHTTHIHYPNLLNFIRLFLETLFPQG